MSVRISDISNANAPDGVRLYAIGDIHGRADLLDQLIRLIQDDQRRREKVKVRLVFLGDYVDRGPNSKGVTSRLLKGFPEGFEAITLKGNHEDMLLSFLDEATFRLNWLQNGGDATLLSYGVAQDVVQRAFWGGRQGLDEAAAVFGKALPADHLNFYQSLAPYYRAGDYFFVHAGVNPGLPLDMQSEDEMLWIRDEFLNWPHDFGAVVVHGHTPVRDVEDRHNRIGIDTYAFHTGKLTAVGLEGSRRWFLST